MMLKQVFKLMLNTPIFPKLHIYFLLMQCMNYVLIESKKRRQCRLVSWQPIK